MVFLGNYKTTKHAQLYFIKQLENQEVNSNLQSTRSDSPVLAVMVYLSWQ